MFPLASKRVLLFQLKGTTHEPGTIWRIFAEQGKALREIERQAGYFGEIETSSHTIKSGAAKILKRVDAMRSALEKQIAMLDQQSEALRVLAGDSGAQ